MARLRGVAVATLCLSLFGATPSPSQELKGNTPPKQSASTKSSTASAQSTPTQHATPTLDLSGTPKAQGKATYPTETPNQESVTNQRIADYTEAVAQYTLALAVFAFLQFVAMIIQAVYLGKSLRDTREALRIAEGAYVGVQKVDP